jgi:hypothetical protein
MAFNPDEPRDFHGRWTASETGEAHTAPGMPFVRVDDPAQTDIAKHLAEQAADVAKALDFDPAKINVTDQERTFELNGQTHHAAGTYHPDTDTINLYSKQLVHGTQFERSFANSGLIAHEIEHAKFQALLNDYKSEYEALQKDPDYEASKPTWEKAPGADDGTTRPVYGPRTDTFMHPDGRLKEPYAERYPVYSAYTDTFIKAGGIHDHFAKTDGVSHYSKEWWTDWANGKAQTDSAMHETLAEMARIKYTGGSYMHFKEGKEPIDGKKVYFATTKGSPKRVSREWAELYKLVEWNWKRRNKK